MSRREFNVLFLCTGNSARSILAEALLNHFGAGRFRAYSAGSHPRGSVHPLALEVLREANVSVAGLRSKSRGEFERVGAPAMDFIVTVCDSAAGEACPLWLGHPVNAHWGIADPAAAEGTECERKAAFAAALGFLRNRIEAFVALPIRELEPAALQSALRAIGVREGASAGVVAHD